MNAEGFCVTRAYILWDCYVVAWFILLVAAFVSEGTPYKSISFGLAGASVTLHVVLVMHTTLFGLLRTVHEAERSQRRTYNIVAVYFMIFLSIIFSSKVLMLHLLVWIVSLCFE